MPKKLAEDDAGLDLFDIDTKDDDIGNNIDTSKDDDDGKKDGINSKKHSIKKNKKNSNSVENETKNGKRIKQDDEGFGSNEEAGVSEMKKDDLVESDDPDSKFFVVRVSGGQENLIASMLYTKITTKKIEGIYSIMFLDNFKGYVIVEALDSNIAYEALHGIRHIRGQIRGELPFKDLEGYLVKKPVVTELVIDDTVEIIAGPFKSMKAKIMRVDYEKQEATVVLLDSPYQIPVTVDANYLKKAL
ncbi:MAG TPA: transcription elongation factor Spt5 [Candidatus Nitrosocosmicus sp.]